MSFTEDCEIYLFESNIRTSNELEKMSNKEIRDLCSLFDSEKGRCKVSNEICNTGVFEKENCCSTGKGY